MKKRKCDWCYFTDGSKKKITNWWKPDEDILFFIDDKLYLYKRDCFGYEEPSLPIRKNLIFPIIPKGKFYMYRFCINDYSLSHIDKNDDTQWLITNIERIELRR